MWQFSASRVGGALTRARRRRKQRCPAAPALWLLASLLCMVNPAVISPKPARAAPFHRPHALRRRRLALPVSADRGRLNATCNFQTRAQDSGNQSRQDLPESHPVVLRAPGTSSVVGIPGGSFLKLINRAFFGHPDEQASIPAHRGEVPGGFRHKASGALMTEEATPKPEVRRLLSARTSRRSAPLRQKLSAEPAGDGERARLSFVKLLGGLIFPPLRIE
jgi:hypothetical protein